MPLDHPTYDPIKADHDARNIEPKKVKNPKIRKSAESPRRGQTVRISTDDPFMNFTVGGRTYRTKNGATDIPVEDAAALIAANIPGVRVHGAWSGGLGPGARFNGRFRHEWDLACNCRNADCKWPWPEYEDEDEE
jgi:hypothetical protein